MRLLLPYFVYSFSAVGHRNWVIRPTVLQTLSHKPVRWGAVGAQSIHRQLRLGNYALIIGVSEYDAAHWRDANARMPKPFTMYSLRTTALKSTPHCCLIPPLATPRKHLRRLSLRWLPMTGAHLLWGHGSFKGKSADTAKSSCWFEGQQNQRGQLCRGAL